MPFVFQKHPSHDQVTKKNWKNINSVITENFDEADITSGNSELKKFLKKYLLSSDLSFNENLFVKELIENFISSTTKMEILGVFGSAMEGGLFSVFNFNSSGDYEFDFDLMVGFGPQPLSRSQQEKGFRHIPDKPGHLNIEVESLDNWNIDRKYLLTKNSRDYVSPLKVKQEFTLVNKSEMTENLKVYIDSDPFAGKASVSVNIEIKSRNILSMERAWREFFDGMLNIPFMDEKDQIRLNETWQNINFDDSLFKKIKLHVDIVPSIKCDSWPHIAEDWKRRKRFWPPKSLVNRIIQEGHHVVGKASPGGDSYSEWRLSFSEAELTLAEHRTHIQKKIYYIFKTIFKENLGKSDEISTYYLKTIMMWAMEQNPPEYWREDNIGQAVLGLLDDLYQALLTRTLSHYFIPQLNLLRHISWDILDEEADDLLHLRKNILNINRNEPILLSPNAKGTEYETVMRVSRKKFKAYHAKLIEFLSRNGVRCYVKYYESVFFKSELFTFLQKDIKDTLKEVEESRINLMHCFDFPKLDLLEEYLIGQYGNHTDLIEQKIKEEKENVKRYPKKVVETFEELFHIEKILKDMLLLSKSNSLYLLNLYVNMSNHNYISKLRAIQVLREAQINSESADSLIYLTTIFNAENVLKGTSLKEVLYQKAIILKVAADHCLRETRTYVIETINSSDKLEKRAFALLNININATEEIEHLMSRPSPVFDNLDKLSIQAKAMEYFKLTVEYTISGRFNFVDVLYPDFSNRLNRVNQILTRAIDATNRLIEDVADVTNRLIEDHDICLL